MERYQPIERRLGDLEQVADRLVVGDAGEGERGQGDLALGMIEGIKHAHTQGGTQLLESFPQLRAPRRIAFTRRSFFSFPS